MSRFAVYSIVAGLSFIPISELRGAIPFAIANNVPWYTAFIMAVFFNALVTPVCWIFLSTLHKLFLKMNWYGRFFERFIEKARTKLHDKVERWGWLGLIIFIAIPLPLTGAWTGTLGAWVLGIPKRKTMVAVIIGLIGCATIVTVIMLLGVQALNIFIKKN